ncbi:TfpX/TfpZ family type IV pilin accessory protein [Hydrogenophaga sp. A37]|uniref:TfpX/TfpZ family type IV pilin accessory protein n=1 Tax=Hydrogenophaga sp. A37 TaxID=1945864 RepID=UPI00209AAFEE|nr:TfpX/TfpZ family type IV pilin accessory protein [Hydrogenophaga sp. A37]
MAAVRAAAVHFFISVLVAAMAAALVFGLWYPYPYRDLAGGRELFLIVVAVDLVCGPLLTLVLFNPKKSKRELFLDLSLVALVQLAALGYGMYTVAQARPVYLVFEVDRFKVVSVADIQPGALKPEMGGFHILPWTGPTIIGLRDPRNPDEKLQSMDLSMQGLEPSARPDWWQPYELNKAQVLTRAKPIDVLRIKQPDAASLIDQAVRESGEKESALGWVPLTSFKSTNWVAFVNLSTAKVLAFAPVDGF